MADVRSMLRSELASRKATSAAPPASKKRKHVAEDTADRKRARNEDPEPYVETGSTPVDSRPKDTAISPPPTAVEPSHTQPRTDHERDHESDGVDEDEWAKFEREIAGIQYSAPSNPLAALTAQPALEAAPLSAEELAKQAREEMSAQKGAKDIEGEEEKEDEAKRMEDEFEEMEALESRVKKLRERREALRKGSLDTADQGGSDGDDGGETVEGVKQVLKESNDAQEEPTQNNSASGESQSDSDSEEDEWANWGRR